MTAVSTDFPHQLIRWNLKSRVVAKLTGLFQMSADDPDDARARREFVQDVLKSNPQAFASELDVQSMMCTFPGRF